MALVSHKDKAHRHPDIVHVQLWPCHSPNPQPHTLRVPPPEHWDPCSTEALEAPDPKTGRIWGKSEALGGSTWVFSWWILCPAVFAHHKPSLVPVLFASAPFQPPWSPPFCSSSFPALSHHPWTGPVPTSLWSLSNPH